MAGDRPARACRRRSHPRSAGRRAGTAVAATRPVPPSAASMTGTHPACKWSAVVLSLAVTATFRETELWRDLVEVPDALRQTLAAADGFDAAAAALRGATRVIATGNGAAYYVAQAMWLASLDGGSGPAVEALPGGLVAGGRFPWRTGDRLLAVSSSGEFRGGIDAGEHGAPRAGAWVDAKPHSSDRPPPRGR